MYIATDPVKAAGACRTKETGLFADGNTFREGTRGTDGTAATAAIGAQGLASRAGEHLADEEGRGGHQRRLAASVVLGLEERQKKDGDEEETESFDRHCFKRGLLMANL